MIQILTMAMCDAYEKAGIVTQHSDVYSMLIKVPRQELQLFQEVLKHTKSPLLHEWEVTLSKLPVTAQLLSLPIEDPSNVMGSKSQVGSNVSLQVPPAQLPPLPPPDDQRTSGQHAHQHTVYTGYFIIFSLSVF